MGGTASWLATVLDQEMLEVSNKVHIAPRFTPDHLLPRKSGKAVAGELGNRYLIRYLLPAQVGQMTAGAVTRQFVTPTPIGPSDTVSYLALPAPKSHRLFALLLKPGQIHEIWGPRWIAMGKGIEYILPRGFDATALALAWALQLK
jgi:hypothetical protein